MSIAATGFAPMCSPALIKIGLKGMIGKGIRSEEVKNFPVVVINDIYGGDLYQQGIEKYPR